MNISRVEKEHKAPLSRKKQKLLNAKMRELKSLSKKAG